MQVQDTPSQARRVTKRLRFEVLRRDGYRCRYCGLTASESELTVDHVLPVALGGRCEADNLVAACKDCNAGKSSASPDASLVDQVSDDALRWGRAITRSSELIAAQRAEDSQFIEEADWQWTRWTDGNDQQMWRPADWQISFMRWASLGLSLDDFIDSIAIAMANDRLYREKVWRYVCGIMWRKAEDLQKRARDLIDAGVV